MSARGPSAPSPRKKRTQAEIKEHRKRRRKAQAALREKELAEGLERATNPSVSNRICPHTSLAEEQAEREEVVGNFLDAIRAQLPALLALGIPLIPATDSEPNRPPVPKDSGRLFRRIPAGHSDLNRPPCELTRPGYWLCNLRSSVRSTHCVFFALILRADVSYRRCAPDGRGSHRPGWPGRGTHANVRAAAGWSRWSSAC